MSAADESAVDHLVNEVLESRSAAEAAVAPDGAPLDTEDAPAQPEPEPEFVVEDSAPVGDDDFPTIGFADVDADAGDLGDAVGAASVEGAVAIDGDELAQLRAERDGFLADSQRLAADFSNFRKQSEKRVADAAAAQSAGLVRDLIPVLDACDSALVQDPESAAGPIRSALITELEKNGLELLAPSEDELFDPELHEAVMHEAASDDSDHEGPVVGEVLRAGYLWKGRVVRPAMVKVIG